MAIRFTCPSCSQPIEIDDQWAGQSVGCPYCKKVVNAPPASTWPPSEVPQASPAPSAFTPPPPPQGYIQGQTFVASRSPLAGWALTLALTCVVLCILAWVVVYVQWIMLVIDKLGPNAKPTQEQVAQVMMDELTTKGYPSNSFSTAAAGIGAVCGIGGLFLAVRSLLRHERRRGMAITACIFSALFLLCQFPVMMLSCAKFPASPPGRTQTAPAAAPDASHSPTHPR